MKNRYEALFVLNTQGKEDTVKDIVDRLESEFQKEGAEIEVVQKMDKRPFSYVAGPLDAGFYVNFVFHADPQLITKLRSKFKLDPEVYRQTFQRLREKRVKKERAPKKLAPAK
jgi:small subunit ribosomal protein S6